MEIEVIKKLVKKHYLTGHLDFMRKTQVAERYYRNKNDILYKKKSFKEDDESENPLRNADNRISSNFYNLLVNQKASYMFTAPPLFDVGDKGTNEQIADFFGDKYAKVCKDLCINASNSGVGWLHIWRDENDLLKYGVINSKQIIPIWSDDIEQELKAVLRIYPYTDENGEQFKICQYWNKEECYSYIFQMEDYETFIPESFKEFDMFTVIHSMGQFSKESVTKHNFGEVPFIPFFNNNSITSDLDTVKPLIDTYDKVFSVPSSQSILA